MKPSRLLASGPLLLLLLVIAVSGPLPAQSLCEGPVVMGWEPWEPFEYEREGRLVGFDIDLMKAVMADLGCELRFREVPWTRHLEEIKKGTVHLAVGVARTEERESFGYFSAPFRQDDVRLWVRAGEGERYPFENLAELASSDFRLGVVRSYVYGTAFGPLVESSAFGPGQIVRVDGEAQLFPMLVRGRIDGLFAERANVAVQLREQGFEGRIEPHAIVVSQGQAYVLFSRASVSPELVEAFNQSLQKLRDDGTYQRVVAEYLQ